MSITAILSALAEEQQGLIEQLTHPQAMHRAGRMFWRGELDGHRVVLALSKIGKVAAATTATTLIEAFGVERIVFTGVAGGMGPGVLVGDAVVATEFVQHDMDASPLFLRYEVPLYGRRQFHCDTALTDILLAATRQAFVMGGREFNQNLNVQPPAVHTGLIVSGDRFVSGVDECQSLLNGLRSVGLAPQAVEMEGAAVAQVCFDYGVPFAAVRTISDRADDNAPQDFSRFVREVAGPCAVAVVRSLMPKLP